VSHLFAYLARMKFIKRWGLMHNTYPESIQEHSHRVAVIATRWPRSATACSAAASIRRAPPCWRSTTIAGEVLTGDLPAPVKYFNPEIRGAYREIEAAANQRLLGMVPEPLRDEYRSLFVAADGDKECWELVKAADKLCAYLKCVEEVAAGNREFSRAEQALRATVEALAPARGPLLPGDVRPEPAPHARRAWLRRPRSPACFLLCTMPRRRLVRRSFLRFLLLIGPRKHSGDRGRASRPSFLTWAASAHSLRR